HPKLVYLKILCFNAFKFAAVVKLLRDLGSGSDLIGEIRVIQDVPNKGLVADIVGQSGLPFDSGNQSIWIEPFVHSSLLSENLVGPPYRTLNGPFQHRAAVSDFIKPL